MSFSPRWRGGRLLRRMAPWSALVLLAAVALNALPVAFAAQGDSAQEAIPVGTDGHFTGTVVQQKSLWYRFAYAGNSETATIQVAYEPADSNRTDLFVYTGSASSPRKEGNTATRTNNTLEITFSDPNAQDVFVQVVNDHPDRSVSLVGTITPTSVLNAPSAGTQTPTPGPAANSAQGAITVGSDGVFNGALGANQAVWHRFWYGNPGADATVSASIAPNADDTALNVYTGTDLNNLDQQSGNADRSGDTLTRRVNLSTTQFVYFTVVNNKGATPIAYGGKVTPAYAPPTPTPAPATATATPAATATAAPVATSTPQPAPPMAHDERYFFATGYRIDSDGIWGYFNSRGRIDTFGYPVSRTFQFLGCDVQIFQRQVAQICPGRGGVALINLLDPELFPYTRVNGSVFPSADDGMKNATPKVTDPNYADAIIQFVRANAPDTYQGQPVNFGSTFFGTVSAEMANTDNPGILGLIDLEVWGAPISQPMPDPTNSNFIYQRFQRGIMHYTAGQGTRGILLADYLKAIMRDRDLPADLRGQAMDEHNRGTQAGRYFAQYCPGAPNWLCRPNELQGTNLTFAFEQG